MTALVLVRRACVVVGVVALAGLVGLPSAQVVLRTVFAAPIVGIEEVTRYLLIVLTFVGIPLVTAGGGQIRMEELLNLMPRRSARLSRAVIAAVSAAALAATLVAVCSSIELTIGSSTPTVGIPFWLFNLPAVVGLGAGTVEFGLSTWRAARGGEAPCPPSVVEPGT